MHGGLHPRFIVERVYIQRVLVGIGLTSFRDSVKEEMLANILLIILKGSLKHLTRSYEKVKGRFSFFW